MKFKVYRSDRIEDESVNCLKELRQLFRTQQRINMRNKDLKQFKFIEELNKDKKKIIKNFGMKLKNSIICLN